MKTIRGIDLESLSAYELAKLRVDVVDYIHRVSCDDLSVTVYKTKGLDDTEKVQYLTAGIHNKENINVAIRERLERCSDVVSFSVETETLNIGELVCALLEDSNAELVDFINKKAMGWL